MTLPELYQENRFNTDKGDSYHAFRGRTYLDVYEGLFRDKREQTFTLIELGVLFGGSLRMWMTYFPKAKVVGVDINPEAGPHVPEGATFINTSQTNEISIKAGLEKLPPLGIVIDDGSHYLPHMIKSFRFLWPLLVEGGLYVMEDMRISYGGVDLNWAGMKCNQEPLGMNQREDLDKILLGMIRDMDNLGGSLRSVEFHPMMIALKKSLP
jgi:hypothetical protein